MHEPEFYNQTSFTANLVPLLDRSGGECRVAIIKATFAIGKSCQVRLAEKQSPLRFGDEMWGVPAVPDVKFPADLCVFKPGTDFVLVGHAVPAEGRVMSQMDVSLDVAGRKKVLRVFGERVWQKTMFGKVTLSDPKPLCSVPLAWSRAYGGFDNSNSKHPIEEPRNPVGRGVAREKESLIDDLGPQIEDPAHLISSSSDRPSPAGCAPLGRHFEPRRSFAGTYDAGWLEKVHPARPGDHHEEHENCAHPDLIFKDSLRGGEQVKLTGVTPGEMTFILPKLRILVEAEIDGHLQEQRPHLDTVLINADRCEMELSWRASFKCPAKMRNRFTVVRVKQKLVVG